MNLTEVDGPIEQSTGITSEMSGLFHEFAPSTIRELIAYAQWLAQPHGFSWLTPHSFVN